ncbi:MAG: phosphoenolpyruvate--protein phosphotransferase [Acidobacteriota bacterium]|nr:MAG: phosphoenolpyruvate--protein phosphotransferase [Acidobacteriota bacterium]
MAANVIRSPETASNTRVFPALTLSRGIGSGKIKFLQDAEPTVLRRHLDPAEIDIEASRFAAAFEKCKAELSSLAGSPFDSSRLEASAIFDAQLLILETSGIKEKVLTKMAEHRINAEWALERVNELFHDDFAEIEDPSFREKVQELDDVIVRLRRSLISADKRDLSSVRGCVVAAREVKTSQFYELCENSPAAVIVEHGGWTSHISIIARGFGIPMVTGIGDPKGVISEDEFVTVDGDSGKVIISDAGPMDRSALSSASVETEYDSPFALHTNDGEQIFLFGNADSLDSARRAIGRGAFGIGLFRTDGMIGEDGLPPNESEQYSIYADVLRASGKLPVTIRTFDFGVESFREKRAGPNPALGLRSLRICLTRPDFFRAQLRALLRAAGNSELRLMLPMVSGLSDLLSARGMVEDVFREIGSSDPTASLPAIGVMVELPSAVLTIDSLADASDFLCVGTNDLVQYLLGADRDNETVAAWYQSLHPAVIRSLESVARAAADRSKEVTICGEMASAPFYLPLLLGLGYRNFSMHSGAFSAARSLIANISMADCKVIAATSMDLNTAGEIESYLLDLYTRNWADLFPRGMLDRFSRKPEISET